MRRLLVPSIRDALLHCCPQPPVYTVFPFFLHLIFCFSALCTLSSGSLSLSHVLRCAVALSEQPPSLARLVGMLCSSEFMKSTGVTPGMLRWLREKKCLFSVVTVVAGSLEALFFF